MTAPTPDPRPRPGRLLPLLGVALAVVLVVVIAVIVWPSPAEQAQVVRLVGSNTIGSDVAPELAAGFLRSQGATDVERGGDGGVVTVEGTPAGATIPVRFEIRSAGTETALAALRDGAESGEPQVEIGMASRRITDEEAAALTGAGDLHARESEHVVALDAVAVVVPRGSGLAALSIEQLRAVYTCAVTDWADVGGTPGPIRVLARDDNSGTWESFRDAVLAGQPLCAAAERFEDSAALSAAVAADPSAIGFVALPFVGGNTALDLYDEGTARVGPTAADVTTETYLLTRRLYFYLPTRPIDNALARQFVEGYVLSDAGQVVIEQRGLVSPYRTPEPVADAPACASDLPEYCAATDGAQRVPFDVRFAAGTDAVDNRGYRNLDLLAESLRAGEPREVLLVGFADNSGTVAGNLDLSRRRAGAVGTYLAGRGVVVGDPSGFGDALPVAGNDTPEGREQNRRVEVWLR